MLSAIPAGRMYNFFIDDNIFFFQELVRRKCRTLWDCGYLRELRRLHQEFGVCFTLNTFYRNWHDSSGFTLAAVPDDYRSQFEENSCWLRLAFHADSEFPERPYSEACPDLLAEHFDRWCREMERIAGGKTLTPPMVIHYFDLTPENRRRLREAGMKFLAVRQGALTCNREYDQYEVPVDGFLNLFNDDAEALRRHFSGLIATGREKLLVGTHEQYAFSHYPRYQPGYFGQLRMFCRLMADNGYRPVFFNDLI